MASNDPFGFNRPPALPTLPTIRSDIPARTLPPAFVQPMSTLPANAKPGGAAMVPVHISTVTPMAPPIAKAPPAAPPAPVAVKGDPSGVPGGVMAQLPSGVRSGAQCEAVIRQPVKVAPTVRSPSRVAPAAPADVPCRNSNLPQGLRPAFFSNPRSNVPGLFQGGGLNGFDVSARPHGAAALQGLDGTWEDWCDAAADTWFQVTGNRAEAEQYRAMCKVPKADYKGDMRAYAGPCAELSKCFAEPKTVLGHIARGLPAEFSTDPNVVRAGAAGKVISTVTNPGGGGGGGGAASTFTTPSTSGGGSSGGGAVTQQQGGGGVPARTTPAADHSMMPLVAVGVGVAGLSAWLFLRKRRNLGDADLEYTY